MAEWSNIWKENGNVLSVMSKHNLMDKSLEILSASFIFLDQAVLKGKLEVW